MLGAERRESVTKRLNADLVRVPAPGLDALGGGGALVTNLDGPGAASDASCGVYATIFDARVRTDLISIPHRRPQVG